MIAVSEVGRLSVFARENVIFTGVQSSKDNTPECTAKASSFRDADHEQREERIWASRSTSGATA
jgi:hypothetical protein